jgi:predicted ATPase/DNA-binding SARP family transcriptional activator
MTDGGRELYVVEMFGGLQIRRQNTAAAGGSVVTEEVITRFRSHGAAGLIGYLAYRRDRRHPREVLIDMLWPETPKESARHNLSVALSSLRGQLEPPGVPSGSVIVADRVSVGVNPAAVTTDVARFEALLAEADRHRGDDDARADLLRQALALHRDTLVPGHYEAWINPAQEELNSRQRGAMLWLAQYSAAHGAEHDALTYAGMVITADPENHEAETIVRRISARLSRSVAGATPTPGASEAPGPKASRHTAKTTARRRQSPPPPPPRPPLPPPDKTANDPSPVAAPGPVEAPLFLPRTRFFGRGAEMDRLRRRIADPSVRLITLTGPGGSGKTRLARELVRSYREEGAPFQVYFADLTPLTDAADIATAITRALGLPSPAQAGTQEDPTDALVAALNAEPGPLLLVLDNFEQILPEGAWWLEGLLDRVPLLTCLVTSRARLLVGGEETFEVEPLPIPDAAVLERLQQSAGPLRADASLSGRFYGGSGGGIEGIGDGVGELADTYDLAALLEEWPSVALFVDRARQVRSAFRLTSRNAADLVRVVTALEGLPLAIELAAARIQVFTPARLLEELPGHRFDVLQQRGRPMHDRHRSLHATLAWSVDLLSPDLREAFARLSVFRGGWTAEAAEAVLNSETALDDLAQLCDASLVRVTTPEETEDEAGGEQLRFSLLEVIREYAAELLEQGPEDSRRDALERHAAFFESIAVQIGPLLQGGEQARWIRHLRTEHDNLHAALDRTAAATADTASSRRVMTFGAGLYRYWMIRGDVRYGRSRLEPTLSRRHRPLRREAGPHHLVRVLIAVGILAQWQGDLSAARLRYRQALWLVKRHDSANRSRLAALWNNLGAVASDAGRYDEAARWCAAACAAYTEIGADLLAGMALSNLAEVEARRGRTDEAARLYEQAAAIAHDRGDTRGEGFRLQGLGEMLFRRGDIPGAERRWRLALRLLHGLSDTAGCAGILLNFGLAAMERGDRLRAAWLLASGERALAEQAVPFAPFIRAEYLRLGLTPGSHDAVPLHLEQAVGRILRENTFAFSSSFGSSGSLR